MNVLMISPGYPPEMPYFTRGLARMGARVFGLGDQPGDALPEPARESLSDYLQVPFLWDAEEMVAASRRLMGDVSLDRVECLWEPGMILAARMRETLELPGMTVAETIPFRDKGAMKRMLDEAGIRTPHHEVHGTAQGCREAAARIGYPVVCKPIAGAGSADTYRVDSPEHLEEVITLLIHVPQVSVEEFIDGEEYTFDTICIDGEIAYFHIGWYRPHPIIARSLEWVSPQTVTLRDVEAPELRPGRRLGEAVLAALGFRTGLTHMEWFLTPEGEAVFGEIAGRPPGGRTVDIMNYSADIDTFTGWGEAVVRGTFSQPLERRYNVAVIFKRAVGAGRIERIEGLEHLLAAYGEHVVSLDLLPIGSFRRDWRQTLLSDGSVIVRHPDLATTLEMADRFGTDLQIYAG